MAIGLFSAQSFAASFGVFDPRSLAMGGTGVASGDASNASHYNPALLATTHEDDDFSLVIPTVAVGISDPDDLEDAFDAYDAANYETVLDSAIANYNATPANFAALQANAGAVATASQNILTGINTLSNKSVVINANAGVLLAVPGETVAVSVYSAGRVHGGAVLNISSADNALLQDYIDTLACISDAATVDLADIIACDSGTTTDVLNDADGTFNSTDTANALTSTVDLRGAVITEVGVSLASKFESLGGIAIGITPKAVEVDTFDSSLGIDTGDIDIDAFRRSYSDTNIDVGAAMKINENFKVGLVAKNIISKTYQTIGNKSTLKLEPQYRAGVAYQNDWVLLSADLDLTENKGLGFETKSQIAAIGVELDIWDTLQLRAGYSHNMANETAADDGIASVGVGLSPFGIHLDLAVASSNAGIQGGFQLGFKF